MKGSLSLHLFSRLRIPVSRPVLECRADHVSRNGGISRQQASAKRSACSIGRDVGPRRVAGRLSSDKCQLLQIAEPRPIAMPAAELHEPGTRHIQKHDRENPHRINERQTMTISERFLSEVRNYGAVPDRLVRGKRSKVSQNV